MSKLQKLRHDSKRAVRKALKSASPVYRLQKSFEEDVSALRYEIGTLRAEADALRSEIRNLTDASVVSADAQRMILDINLKMSEEIDRFVHRYDVSTNTALAPKSTGALRDVQDISLAMLREVDRICKKHHLKYWLDFGTLLGAVRHKGFVPWDDDMDVSMASDDYKKLLAIIDKELESTDFRFIHVPSQIGKVVHKDFMPQGEDEIIAFIDWGMENKIMFALDIFPYYYAKDSLSDEDLREFLVSATAKKTVLFHEGYAYSSYDKADKLVHKLHKQVVAEAPSSRLFMGLETIANRLVTKPWIVPTHDIFPLAKASFEGGVFSAPRKSDMYLICAYGDYMKPPRTIHKHLPIDHIPVDELKKLKAANT